MYKNSKLTVNHSFNIRDEVFSEPRTRDSDG